MSQLQVPLLKPTQYLKFSLKCWYRVPEDDSSPDLSPDTYMRPLGSFPTHDRNYDMKRILVVDDEQDHAFLFALILEEYGFSVDTFTDSSKALSEFIPGYYDLVILDYRMPNLNGLELYKRIKKLDLNMKAILLSASHEKIQQEIDDIRSGFLVSLKKPISGSELVKEVCNVLNQDYNIPKDPQERPLEI